MTIEQVFDYIKNFTDWEDDLDNSAIFLAAEMFCNSLKDYTKQRTIFRVCGQSGSGKTTQGCNALFSAMEQNKKSPLVLGVRSFVKFHPHYDELLAKYGKEFIREKTNSFALKCLFASLETLAKSKILIVLDLTLLHPILEAYFAEVLTKHGYDINFCILAANKKISDAFILKRKNSLAKAEKGRIVLKSSSKYFYKMLPIGLSFLIKNYPTLQCVVWNVFNPSPVYVGTLSNCSKPYYKNRKIKRYVPLSEENLLQAKIAFYKQMV